LEEKRASKGGVEKKARRLRVGLSGAEKEAKHHGNKQPPGACPGGVRARDETKGDGINDK